MSRVWKMMMTICEPRARVDAIVLAVWLTLTVRDATRQRQNTLCQQHHEAATSALAIDANGANAPTDTNNKRRE